MKIIRTGITRNVFLIGKYAFKIAKTTYKHQHFLQGCLSNWSERNFYKVHIKANYEENLSHYVAPSLFCSWFGLIQIQAKCEPNNNELTKSQKLFFKPLCGTDNKKENFGWYKGKLVCLDYV